MRGGTIQGCPRRISREPTVRAAVVDANATRLFHQLHALSNIDRCISTLVALLRLQNFRLVPDLRREFNEARSAAVLIWYFCGHDGSELFVSKEHRIQVSPHFLLLLIVSVGCEPGSVSNLAD